VRHNQPNTKYYLGITVHFYTCYRYLEFSVVMFYIWRIIITLRTIPMCIIV